MKFSPKEQCPSLDICLQILPSSSTQSPPENKQDVKSDDRNIIFSHRDNIVIVAIIGVLRILCYIKNK